MDYKEILKGLPPDLLVRFNKMNETARQYTLSRILGFSKVESIRNAGSQAKPEMLSSTAKSLEERNPYIEAIVEWGINHTLEGQYGNEKSEFSKSLEEKKKDLQMQQLNHATSVMSPTMAESIEFYRRVATGHIKTYKTTERYAADGKTLIERKKEIIDDVDARMRAREKLDRLLGINAIQNLGQVQVGSISINIVDASKKDEDEDERKVDVQDDAIITNETIIEQEPIVEVEVEKPKPAPKPTRKEVKEQMDKDLDAAYEKMMKKRAEREAKRKNK